MRQLVLDTNHASALLRKNPQVRERLELVQQFDRCGLTLPVVGELWYMVFNSARIRENTDDLDCLLRDFRYWNFDEAAAVEFGRVRAELRRKGFTIPSIDVQTAAIARANDLTVITADRHFAFIDNLKLENWLA